MTLHLLITFGLMLFAATDFVLPADKKFHRLMYQLAFAFVFVFSTIKYYYGADIHWYVRMYDVVAPPMDIVTGKFQWPAFEIGYTYFCSICKYIGLSYWGHTAVVSVIYFYAIHRLFRLMPRFKVLALFLLFTFDVNLILVQNRQCMAVSFLILAYLAYCESKKIRTLLYALLALSMHKSAILFALPVGVFWMFGFQVKKENYMMVFALMLLLLILPMNKLLFALANAVGMSENMLVSLNHHLAMADAIQPIFILYAFMILFLCVCDNQKNYFSQMKTILLVSSLALALLYPYYASLLRYRSYFMPFFIVYILSTCSMLLEQEDNVKSILNKVSQRVLMQASCGVFVLFAFFSTYVTYNWLNSLKSNPYTISTVFDLLKRDEKEIREERMELAKKNWELDFVVESVN
jgi:hypothetical protein